MINKMRPKCCTASVHGTSTPVNASTDASTRPAVASGKHDPLAARVADHVRAREHERDRREAVALERVEVAAAQRDERRGRRVQRERERPAPRQHDEQRDEHERAHRVDPGAHVVADEQLVARRARRRGRDRPSLPAPGRVLLHAQRIQEIVRTGARPTRGTRTGPTTGRDARARSPRASRALPALDERPVRRAARRRAGSGRRGSRTARRATTRGARSASSVSAANVMNVASA